ncbi:hypothetical protein H5410_044017 [Solanum commersonii]|uniref:Uncharacterized protein n=1 Tax=Solanum commersonii TaxID=4109 RepID=A0A9J5Y0Y0_SOLCO|nr:hypothetical protein H5410_044017 [Solanum commersonii]
MEEKSFELSMSWYNSKCDLAYGNASKTVAIDRTIVAIELSQRLHMRYISSRGHRAMATVGATVVKMCCHRAIYGNGYSSFRCNRNSL